MKCIHDISEDQCSICLGITTRQTQTQTWTGRVKESNGLYKNPEPKYKNQHIIKDMNWHQDEMDIEARAHQNRKTEDFLRYRSKKMAEKENIPLCRDCGEPAKIRKDGLSTGFCGPHLKSRTRRAKKTQIENNGKRIVVDFARYPDGEDIQEFIIQKAHAEYRDPGDQIIFLLRGLMQ